MKYVDFRKFTDENGAQPVYLFEGIEGYFREKGEALLKERFLRESTLDYVSFDGATLKGDKLVALADAVNSFPFVSEKRIVKVTEFYPTEKDYETYLKGLFETPATHSILLIVNTGKGKTGSAVLAKKPNVTYVDCARADEETIKKWIYVTCKRKGVYADGITCGKLAAYCVFDMARIAKETEKLLAYCEEKNAQRLTDEIVDEVVYPDSEYKIYELANAISKKNYTQYMKILTELGGKGFDELSLLSSLVSNFRNLYEVSKARGSNAEIATTLSMTEYAVRKNREQAAKFPKGEILRLYEGIYGAISAVKCGNLTPDSALKWVTANLFFENS